jgi:hypothetical protein
VSWCDLMRAWRTSTSKAFERSRINLSGFGTESTRPAGKPYSRQLSHMSSVCEFRLSSV